MTRTNDSTRRPRAPRASGPLTHDVVEKRDRALVAVLAALRQSLARPRPGWILKILAGLECRHVTVQPCKGGLTLRLGRPSTVVPLDGHASRILLDYLESARACNARRPLFPSQRNPGRSLTPGSLRRIVQRRQREAMS